jgi:hypothetical protein
MRGKTAQSGGDTDRACQRRAGGSAGRPCGAPGWGTILYWDAAAGQATTMALGNTRIGFAAAAAADTPRRLP